MKFIINGGQLVISIEGELWIFPNTDKGYRDMATEWWQWRLK